MAHVFAAFCDAIKVRTGASIGQISPQADPLEAIQYLLGLGIGKQHGPVFAHMDQDVWGQGIATLADLFGRHCFRPKAEDHARWNVKFATGGYGKSAQGQGLQQAGIGLGELGQINAEIGEGEVCNRNTSGQILQIDHGILQLDQLLAPILQVIHRIAGLLFNQVFLASSRDIEQHHPTADALL